MGQSIKVVDVVAAVSPAESSTAARSRWAVLRELAVPCRTVFPNSTESCNAPGTALLLSSGDAERSMFWASWGRIRLGRREA